MNTTVDLKFLIPILSAAIIFGGFYYTTQLRLDKIEEELIFLKEELESNRKALRKKIK